jgi:hypothetical protein
VIDSILSQRVLTISLLIDLKGLEKFAGLCENSAFDQEFAQLINILVTILNFIFSTEHEITNMGGNNHGNPELIQEFQEQGIWKELSFSELSGGEDVSIEETLFEGVSDHAVLAQLLHKNFLVLCLVEKLLNKIEILTTGKSLNFGFLDVQRVGLTEDFELEEDVVEDVGTQRVYLVGFIHHHCILVR